MSMLLIGNSLTVFLLTSLNLQIRIRIFKLLWKKSKIASLSLRSLRKRNST